jgi:hypothetical protein
VCPLHPSSMHTGALTQRAASFLAPPPLPPVLTISLQIGSTGLVVALGEGGRAGRKRACSTCWTSSAPSGTWASCTGDYIEDQCGCGPITFLVNRCVKCVLRCWL